MDPKHSGNVLKHLEKQQELLMDAYRSTSHELHRLQVEEEMLMRKYYEFMAALGLTEEIEEEMLMRKYYEFMAALGLTEEKTNTNVQEGEETSQDGALVIACREEES